MRKVMKKSMFVLLLLLACRAQAQTTFGTILGTVFDPSGAVVPGAMVTIRNMDENVVARDLTTGSRGNYEAQNLKAGRYEVTVTAQGFQKYTQVKVMLEARQTLRVNVGLKMGQVNEQVTVEATAAVVSTETQTIASSFGSQQVLELPANYRGASSTSPYNIIAFLPGVQSDNSNNFSLQGGLPSQASISVDGISTVDVRNNGALREMFPSVEGIAEMRVQAVGNNAEYGQVGDITTTTKGGSNAFHGSAFNYLQNAALDAKPFGASLKPAKVANTFGGSLGGRLLRDRTFFFVDYEGMRFRRETTVSNTVPTQAMRNGDFSQESRKPLDPRTGQRYPNDRISEINPVAAKILSFYPLPNFGNPAVQSTSNFRENRPAPITSNQYDVRVDHNITGKQTIFGRWTWKDGSSTTPTRLNLPADQGFDENRALVLSHNYTLSSRLLNEFRFGFARSFRGGSFPLDGAKLVQDLGLQGLGPNFPPNEITNMAFSGSTTNFYHTRNSRVHSESLQFTNNLTWIRGSHTMKFGADLRRLRATGLTSFTTGNDYGDYSFQGTFTGNDFADFLLGIPTSTTIAKTGPGPDMRVWHQHYFAQDSWKASPNLTLEFGLRYEYHPTFTDITFNIANFDRSVPITGQVIIPSNPLAKKITAPGFLSSINACPGPAIGGVPCTPFLTAKEANFPENLRFQDKNNFSPRFGFAYRPFGDTKTVIRGGAGFYTMTILGSMFFSMTSIHSSDVTAFANSVSAGTPAYQFPQTKVGGGATGGALGSQDFRTANAVDYRDPYSIQWNLTAERDLGWGTGLRVSYIGMRSIKLIYAPDLNQPLPSTTPFTKRPLTDRPFPNWNIIFSRDNGANAIYNALQTEVNHRFRGALTFNSNWTWAKNLSDAGGPAPSGFAAENGGGRLSNSRDRRADRGNVSSTRRHRWITTLVYELPFGKGKRNQVGGINRLADAFVGGWSLSNIILLQTGSFLTATMSGGDPSGTNANNRGTVRPDAIGNGNLSNPTADVWWNKDAFICPGRAPGDANRFNCNVTPIARFGNAGVGTLVGPGTINWSLAFGKDFRLKEAWKLKFVASFSNLPNHPNLNDPISANITSASFGKITSARGADSGGNRIGQFTLRLEF